MDGEIVILIENKVIKINTGTVLSSPSIDEGMIDISSKIAWYGELLGAAEKEKIRADSEYRHWYAKQLQEIQTKEEKVSEWKAKSKVEAMKEFIAFKTAIGAAEYNVSSLRVLVRALEEESSNLRSRGANLRAEMNTVDMTTKTRESIDERYRELKELKQSKENEKPARTPVKKG